ncbi:MAG: hypothetical protein L3J41_10755 [Melioribacteraceae bacterium]|nr:hypothetical protein [Melioribacteraceae bacterium]
MKSLLISILLTITISLNAQNELNCLSSGCHDSYMKAENIHLAIEDGCDSCHDQNFENHPKRVGNEFELTSDLNTLCFDCHDEPDEKLMQHEAFAGGDCVTCHSPHSSDNISLLKSEDVGELCADCHDIDNEENMIKHGPVVAGQCNACHEPHQSAFANLLKEESPQLCFNCHTDNKKMLNLPTVHAAYEGSCLDCHAPHNSKYKFLVKDEIPNLCYDCHDDMGSEIDTAMVVHKIINQDKSCISCHLPHASETSTLLVKEGKELCFTCHNKEYKSEDRTLKNIYKIVTKSKVQHEAVESGECIDCHFSHASNNYYLLNAKFPFGSYSGGADPDNFSLCFECHDSDALRLEKTTTATNFRDGDENLHYLHISKNKGRNCTLCHSVHGSNQPHIIAKTVPFGKWQMPLKYKEIENGGSCAPGCHALYKYDREKDN